MLRFHKGYVVDKNLVGNIRIKAFWYTKNSIMASIHLRCCNGCDFFLLFTILKLM
jgi:hypothetical protein